MLSGSRPVHTQGGEDEEEGGTTGEEAQPLGPSSPAGPSADAP